MIFTFYSFKGGVGRSMALANVAEVFYARGLRVLMIDFDLEAPGLERYFDVKNSVTPSAEIPAHLGVIDFILSFLELQSLAPRLPPAAAPHGGGQPEFPFSVEPIENFILPIYDEPSRPGRLSLMPSGNRMKPDFAAYARRVLNFDWARFYTEKDGERFFEWFRQQLVRNWDVVLIDSRTGVTELGGVCTHHLADAVISFVATNLQNLEGSAMMARSLAHPKLVSEGRKGRPLQQLFVPSRVELSEEDKHDEFAGRFNDQFGAYFPASQTPEQSWFLDLRLFYVPAYSYMERVAVREPERASKADLIQAYSRLAARMASMAGAGPLFEAWAPPSRVRSNLPARNPYFAGREDKLKQIRTLLSYGTPVGICGLGGVGKTALAVEYAWRNRGDYAAILFCPASSESGLRRGCEELMRLLSVITSDISAIGAVRGWLEANDNWLLILDSVHDSELIRSVLPERPRGHVLYTGRTQQTSGQTLFIESLSGDVGIAFFEKRLGKRELTEAEKAAATDLVNELGALPLALEQAAAYIVNRGTRIEDYLASYRRRRFSLLDQQTAGSAGGEQSVSATLEPTLEEIEKFPASADVLRMASFLAPDPIPTVLLVSGAQQFGGAIAAALATAADDPLAVDEVLDPLSRFSLIERDSDSQAFSVHRLVAQMVRARVQDPSVWQQGIVAALQATFPVPTWENTGLCAILISHVLAAVAWSNNTVLRLRAAQYLLLRGDYARAEQCLRAGEPFGSSAEAVTETQLLAQIYFAQSRFRDAIGLLERGLAMTGTLGAEDAVHTSLLLNLAGCFAATGEMKRAEELYSQALAESQQRADTPNVVLSLCGRAGILILSDPERAIETARQAVAISENTGADLQTMAYGNLANVLIAGGRAMEPQTVEVLQKALDAAERAYGPQHPVLAGALRMYAVLLDAQGRESEGHAVYRRAQEIIDRTLGPQSASASNFRNEYEAMLASAHSEGAAAKPVTPLDESSSAPAALAAPSPPPVPTVAVPGINGSAKSGAGAALSAWVGMFSDVRAPRQGPRRFLYLGAAVMGVAVVVFSGVEFSKSRMRTGSQQATTAPVQQTPSGATGAAANQANAAPQTSGNKAADGSAGYANSSANDHTPAPWGVVISADKQLEPASPEGPSAEWEPVRASRGGYRNTALFQRGDLYWTVIGEPDQQAAESLRADIRKDPPYQHWSEATVVNISDWCPNLSFDRTLQVAEVSINLFSCAYHEPNTRAPARLTTRPAPNSPYRRQTPADSTAPPQSGR